MDSTREASKMLQQGIMEQEQYQLGPLTFTKTEFSQGAHSYAIHLNLFFCNLSISITLP